MCLRVLPSRQMLQYTKPGRLADVMALIQVLALDKAAHRSEQGLQQELQGLPQSASSWTQVAKEHPEFFRVAPESTHIVSLIARHVLPRDENDRRSPLPEELVGRLLQSAVELYDRQIRLAERWTYLIPIWVALIGGVFAVITAWVK